METVSALLAFCAGNSPVTGEFPAQSQWCRPLMLSLICAWINGWVNNGEAGDLRRHHAHYDVIVMLEIWKALLRDCCRAVCQISKTCPFRNPILETFGAYNNTSYRILKKIQAWDHFTWPTQPTSSYQLINRLIEGLFNGTDFQSPTNGNIYSVTLP